MKPLMPIAKFFKKDILSILLLFSYIFFSPKEVNASSIKADGVFTFLPSNENTVILSNKYVGDIIQFSELTWSESRYNGDNVIESESFNENYSSEKIHCQISDNYIDDGISEWKSKYYDDVRKEITGDIGCDNCYINTLTIENTLTSSIIYTVQETVIRKRRKRTCVDDPGGFQNKWGSVVLSSEETNNAETVVISIKAIAPHIEENLILCGGNSYALQNLIISGNNPQSGSFSFSGTGVSGNTFYAPAHNEAEKTYAITVSLLNWSKTVNITVKGIPNNDTWNTELQKYYCESEGTISLESQSFYNYVFSDNLSEKITSFAAETSNGKIIGIQYKSNNSDCPLLYNVNNTITVYENPVIQTNNLIKTKGEAVAFTELYTDNGNISGVVFSPSAPPKTTSTNTVQITANKDYQYKACSAVPQDATITVKVPSYTPTSLDIWYQDASFSIDGKMNNHHASATYSADIGSISSGVYTPSQVGDDTIRTTIFGYEYKLPVKVKTPTWINTEIEKYAGQSSGTLEDNVDDFHSDLSFSFEGVSAVKTTVLAHEKETPGKSYTASFRGYGLGNFTIKTITPKWKTTTREEWKGETITLCDLMSDIPDCSDISFSSDKGSISTTKILTVDYSGIATVTAIIYGESYTTEIESKEHSFSDVNKDGYIGQSSFDIEGIVENYHPTSIITVNGTESTNGKFSYITAGINTIQITATGQEPISKEIEVLEPSWLADDLSAFTGTSALDLYKNMTDVPARTDVVFTADIGTISNGFYLYDEVGNITITAEVYGHTYEKTLEVFTHSFMDLDKDGYIGQSSFDIEDIVENYHPTSTILIDGVVIKDGKFKYEVEGIKRVIVLADAQEVITRTIDVILPKWETEEKLYFKGETVDLYALMEDAPDLSEVVFTTNKGRIHSNKDLIMEFSGIATVTATIYGESYTTEIESKEHSFMNVEKDGYIGQSSFDIEDIVENYHPTSIITVNGTESTNGKFSYITAGINTIQITATGQDPISKEIEVLEVSWDEMAGVLLGGYVGDRPVLLSDYLYNYETGVFITATSNNLSSHGLYSYNYTKPGITVDVFTASYYGVEKKIGIEVIAPQWIYTDSEKEEIVLVETTSDIPIDNFIVNTSPNGNFVFRDIINNQENTLLDEVDLSTPGKYLLEYTHNHYSTRAYITVLGKSQEVFNEVASSIGSGVICVSVKKEDSIQMPINSLFNYNDAVLKENNDAGYNYLLEIKINDKGGKILENSTDGEINLWGPVYGDITDTITLILEKKIGKESIASEAKVFIVEYLPSEEEPEELITSVITVLPGDTHNYVDLGAEYYGITPLDKKSNWYFNYRSQSVDVYPGHTIFYLLKKRLEKLRIKTEFEFELGCKYSSDYSIVNAPYIPEDSDNIFFNERAPSGEKTGRVRAYSIDGDKLYDNEGLTLNKGIKEAAEELEGITAPLFFFFNTKEGGSRTKKVFVR